MVSSSTDIRLRLPGFRRYAAELDSLRTRLGEVERELAAAHESRDSSNRVAGLTASIQALGLKPQLQIAEWLNTHLTTEIPGGIRYSCASQTEYRRIKRPKPWDAPIADWIEGFTTSDVFYDIGANIGVFSLFAAKRHGRHVRVLSFEPAVDTFAALTRNILLNKLEAFITPLQVALFDETGLQPFHYQELGAGTAFHAVGDAVDYRQRHFEPAAVQPVLAFKLDDLVESFGLPRPTRIKLDVDGIESRVLAGAARTLAVGRCDLWVELSDLGEHDSRTARITETLAGLGFKFETRIEHEGAPDSYPHFYDVLFKHD